MRSIFLYEHLTGGGLSGGDQPLAGSLLREGLAMADALAADLAAIEGVHVVLLRDRRLCRSSRFASRGVQVVEVASAAEARTVFAAVAAECQATVIIAPEIDGVLLDCVLRAEQAGATLLSPDSEFVRLTSDKHATCLRLRAAGVPVPRGVILARGESLPRDGPFPAVLKPRDGAGSHGLRFLPQHPGAEFVVDHPSRLEQFIPGLPASASVLYGRDGLRACLPPCRQLLSADGRFSYQGGALPLDAGQAVRATRMVEQACLALPPTFGYAGFDFVLGEAQDGSQDAMIEVNPRLTTSYIGLRAACRQNLAAVMLDLASGKLPALSFSTNPLEFDAAGNIAGSLRESSAGHPMT